ncbi:hypothetical protein HanXRQr2_Chr14g0666221 [Helianthus annuus]|uniref:Uncharacterized protein n=1 Tax=Helianthus annuus TaxID=4232 RepID=A0A9K3EEC7_HELAN|nr:hypothetical protein HanXRQr2_Chr14g0666221 [Helianthus annuus]KAJ0842233.1 hypothetical protein HanPSC8_Chr14g0639321 [Helianthus annuus]
MAKTRPREMNNSPRVTKDRPDLLNLQFNVDRHLPFDCYLRFIYTTQERTQMRGKVERNLKMQIEKFGGNVLEAFDLASRQVQLSKVNWGS